MWSEHSARRPRRDRTPPPTVGLLVSSPERAESTVWTWIGIRPTTACGEQHGGERQGGGGRDEGGSRTDAPRWAGLIRHGDGRWWTADDAESRSFEFTSVCGSGTFRHGHTSYPQLRPRPSPTDGVTHEGQRMTDTHVGDEATDLDQPAEDHDLGRTPGPDGGPRLANV